MAVMELIYKVDNKSCRNNI